MGKFSEKPYRRKKRGHDRANRRSAGLQAEWEAKDPVTRPPSPRQTAYLGHLVDELIVHRPGLEAFFRRQVANALTMAEVSRLIGQFKTALEKIEDES